MSQSMVTVIVALMGIAGTLVASLVNLRVGKSNEFSRWLREQRLAAYLDFLEANKLLAGAHARYHITAVEGVALEKEKDELVAAVAVAARAGLRVSLLGSALVGETVDNLMFIGLKMMPPGTGGDMTKEVAESLIGSGVSDVEMEELNKLGLFGQEQNQMKNQVDLGREMGIFAVHARRELGINDLRPRWRK